VNYRKGKLGITYRCGDALLFSGKREHNQGGGGRGIPDGKREYTQGIQSSGKLLRVPFA